MTLSESIKPCAEAIGCPEIDGKKKCYWSLAQGYVEENFLFIAGAFFVAKGLEWGERQGDRMRLLFDDFICSNYGALYANVAHHQRTKAQNIVNANAYNNYGLSVKALAACVEEVSFVVQGKLAESPKIHGSLPNSLEQYANPRRRVKTKWWQQRIFGAKRYVWVPVRHKTVAAEKIDMVMEKWGPAPWLSHLWQMS